MSKETDIESEVETRQKICFRCRRKDFIGAVACDSCKNGMELHEALVEASETEKNGQIRIS